MAEQIVHQRLRDIAEAMRIAKVPVRTLAASTGIPRGTLGAVLEGLTADQMDRLVEEAREHGCKLDPKLNPRPRRR